MRKRKVFRRRLLMFTIVVIIGILFIQSTWISKQLYPIKYEKLIVDKSQKYDVDPHLIVAIIRVESNFRTSSESPKGAVGLMQLMPTTAEWIVERIAKNSISDEELKLNPELNIELGTWYLAHLLERYEGDMILSIAAYNAGPGNVSKWLTANTWDGQYETADQIPFGETRNYVQKVIYYYNKYKELYPGLT